MTALYANKIVKVNRAFYHYYQSPNSTVRVRNNIRSYDRIKATRAIIDDCNKRKIYDKFKNVIDYKFINMTASNIAYTCFGQFDEPDIEKLIEIQQDVKKYIPKYYKSQHFLNLAFELRWHMRRVVKSPKFALWLHNHNIDKHFFGFHYKIDSIFRKIFKRKQK